MQILLPCKKNDTLPTRWLAFAGTASVAIAFSSLPVWASELNSTVENREILIVLSPTTVEAVDDITQASFLAAPDEAAPNKQDVALQFSQLPLPVPLSIPLPVSDHLGHESTQTVNHPILDSIASDSIPSDDTTLDSPPSDAIAPDSTAPDSTAPDNIAPDGTAPDDTLETQLEVQSEPSQPATAEPSSIPDAATPDAADNRWQFSVEPYLFAPLDVDADITVRGRTASVEAGLDDILNLDRIFSASLRLEARKERLGLIIDGSYLSVGKDGDIDVTIPEEYVARFGINSDVDASADASVDAHQGVLDIAASYRVVDTFLGDDEIGSNPYPRLLVEPILGLRMNWLSQEAEISSIRVAGIELPDQDVELSAFFVEPMIGSLIGLELSERWTVGIRGDISGFNINADRNLAWNIAVGSQYRLSRAIALQLAYQFTKFDYQDGEGSDRLGLDLRQQGLLLGLKFSF